MALLCDRYRILLIRRAITFIKPAEQVPIVVTQCCYLAPCRTQLTVLQVRPFSLLNGTSQREQALIKSLPKKILKGLLPETCIASCALG